ncbi:MAG TPA: endonuclease domain-containing protein [Burkholderiaceae bacterium]|nr:endonuclease domain-containing protein [Burkholderiaceae bacterium]
MVSTTRIDDRGTTRTAIGMRSRSLQQFARTLRAESTDAERRLWYHLRAHRTTGMKFRRQHPIGRYVVDFVCMERRLIIEVDGGQHQANVEHDQLRDQMLQSRGFLVLRFWDDDVLRRTKDVLEKIYEVAQQRRPSPPAPLPQAGEGSKT